LGEQLLAMVPEGEEQDAVVAKWQQFATKAEKGEVPPERVERIAIGILNASNLDTALTAEDADDLLSFAFTEPLLAYSKSNNFDLDEEIIEVHEESKTTEPFIVPAPGEVKDIKPFKVKKETLEELGKELEWI